MFAYLFEEILWVWRFKSEVVTKLIEAKVTLQEHSIAEQHWIQSPVDLNENMEEKNSSFFLLF